MVVHILNKDIYAMIMMIPIRISPKLAILGLNILVMNDLALWKLRRDQVIDMHGDFLSGVYCASEMEG